MYKVSFPYKFIKFVGEKNIIEKREKGSNIIFPIILRLLGRMSSGEKGKGTEIYWKKIEILYKWGGYGYGYVKQLELISR